MRKSFPYKLRLLGALVPLAAALAASLPATSAVALCDANGFWSRNGSAHQAFVYDPNICWSYKWVRHYWTKTETEGYTAWAGTSGSYRADAVYTNYAYWQGALP